jgi:D-alanyl-D-alanine endopeptidase (penicillin-binding protein 7)
MANTHFDDPTGLSPDTLSTARDVVKMAAAASHYPVTGSFTTLPRYEEVVGSRTRFYHNTDPVVLQSDWEEMIERIPPYSGEAGGRTIRTRPEKCRTCPAVRLMVLP